MTRCELISQKLWFRLQHPNSFRINIAQDASNHDRGQKSAISGKFLHWIFWIFSSGFLPFSPGCRCNWVRQRPQPKCGENCEEKRRILSRSGCHVFWYRIAKVYVRTVLWNSTFGDAHLLLAFLPASAGHEPPWPSLWQQCWSCQGVRECNGCERAEMIIFKRSACSFVSNSLAHGHPCHSVANSMSLSIFQTLSWFALTISAK